MHSFKAGDKVHYKDSPMYVYTVEGYVYTCGELLTVVVAELLIVRADHSGTPYASPEDDWVPVACSICGHSI